MAKFKPTPYQQAIFDWFKDGSGNLMIQAVAGSGKTTTIIQALEYIPKNDKVLMLAFNRSIADELNKRVSNIRSKNPNLANISAGTQNSAGLAVLRKWAEQKGLEYKPRLTAKMLEKSDTNEIFGTFQDKDRRTIREEVSKVFDDANKLQEKNKENKHKENIYGETPTGRELDYTKGYYKNKFYYTKSLGTILAENGLSQIFYTADSVLSELYAERNRERSAKILSFLIKTLDRMHENGYKNILSLIPKSKQPPMNCSKFVEEWMSKNKDTKTDAVRTYINKYLIKKVQTLRANVDSIFYVNTTLLLTDKDGCFIPQNSIDAQLGLIKRKDSDAEELSAFTINKLTSFVSFFLSKVVGLSKSNGFKIKDIVPNPTDKVWRRMIYYYQLVRDKKDDLGVFLKAEWIVKTAKKVLDISISNRNIVSFDDQLYQPIYYAKDMVFPQYDWVIIDECQDTNVITQLLLEKILKPKGRLVAIGDVAQAIYGFRGADANAMDSMRKRFNCTPKPLSECFRCAKSIIRLAQMHMKTIQARPEAPEGIVEKGGFISAKKAERDIDLEMFKTNVTSAMICRYNRPLELMSELLIQAQIPFYILGRDLGARVLSLIKRQYNKALKDMNQSPILSDSQWAGVDVDNIHTMIRGKTRKVSAKGDDTDIDPTIYVEEIIARTRKLPKTKIKSKDGKDRVISELHTFAQLEKIVGDMFSDDPKENELCLCTAHRSKGKEFFRVFLLDYDKSFYQKGEELRAWAKTQEQNMAYVAITRAERELIFVDYGSKIQMRKEGRRERFVLVNYDPAISISYGDIDQKDPFIYDKFEEAEDEAITK